MVDTNVPDYRNTRRIVSRYIVLRAKIAPVDGLGGWSGDSVNFVGKAVLAARCLGRKEGYHESVDVTARNIVSCLLDVNNLTRRG